MATASQTLSPTHHSHLTHPVNLIVRDALKAMTPTVDNVKMRDVVEVPADNTRVRKQDQPLNSETVRHKPVSHVCKHKQLEFFQD